VAGFRGGAMGHQLAYTSAAGDLDLQLSGPRTGASALWSIRGQFDPAGADELTGVALFPPGGSAPVAAGEPDSRGMFRLDSPLPTCDLGLLIGDRLIRLEGLGVE